MPKSRSTTIHVDSATGVRATPPAPHTPDHQRKIQVTDGTASVTFAGTEADLKGLILRIIGELEQGGGLT